MKNEGYVYVVKLDEDGIVKVGCTSDFKNRLRTIQCTVPFRIKDYWVSNKFADYYKAEQTILHVLNPLSTGGGTECFSIPFEVTKRIAESACSVGENCNQVLPEAEEKLIPCLGRKCVEQLIDEWCIGTNGKRDRYILKLHYIDGLSYDEIKKLVFSMFACDISVNTLKHIVMYRSRTIFEKKGEKT